MSTIFKQEHTEIGSQAIHTVQTAYKTSLTEVQHSICNDLQASIL